MRRRPPQAEALPLGEPRRPAWCVRGRCRQPAVAWVAVPVNGATMTYAYCARHEASARRHPALAGGTWWSDAP